MSRRLRAVFFLVILTQLDFLLAFVGVREYTLRRGTEVHLQGAPVDPRDLFRGDYVALRYTISTVSTPYSFSAGEHVWVSLRPDASGVWQARGIYREGDRLDLASRDPVFLRGTVERVDRASTNRVSVTYGIEAYFVPEGEGRAIERAREIKVRVAVDGFGNAAIKELIVDGERVRP